MYKQLPFEETVDLLKKYAISNQILHALVGPNVEKMKRSIEVMESDIKKVIDGKEVKPSTKNENDIKDICNILLHLYLTGSLEKKEQNFIYQYASLSFNWAQALSVPDNTLQSINALLVALNMHMSCIDSIKTITMLTNIVQKYLRFDPPAYKISRAYLESIYNELEKE